MKEIEIAFIGGSGLYKLPNLEDSKWISISSEFGNPSSKIRVGTLNGKKIAFLPRHGLDHNISPSKINYRANIDALKKLNVQNIVSISAVGSLREDFKPMDFVLVDQFIDKTYLRKKTFFDDDCVVHVPMSSPVCKNLVKKCSEVLKRIKLDFHNSGTYICIEGPQFSTLAESNLYRSWGCDVIGMTNMPEAKLAREAGICYASLSMVTDYDCWHPDHENVDVQQVVKVLLSNAVKAKNMIKNLIKNFENHIDPKDPTNNCLDVAIITAPEKRTKKTKDKLNTIAGRVLNK